jgi:TolB-like protein
MKNKMFFIILFNIALLGWAQNLIVAVVPFEVKTGYSAGEVEGITELFSSYLVEISGLDIVTRTQFDKILAEQNFQMSGFTSEEDYARLGMALNAKAVTTGSITKLGSRTILLISLIDVETAKIISTSRTQFNDLDELLNKIPSLAKDLVKPIISHTAYKIGDRGPGGGFIFFAENGEYMECSMDIGSASWNDAMRMASNYQGGGFTDWHLPTRVELDLMYKNLKLKGLGGFSSSWHWSSSQSDRDKVWRRSFGTGQDDRYGSKGSMGSVRAVRVF